ncbi:MAG: ATP-binding protein [Gammaproteobacteria bacterium]|nr:ATP-binding protein [Gammaproteobacteria bacterium]
MPYVSENLVERAFTSELQKWQKSPDRKPLVLMGARQVGKTFLFKKFAADHYENSIYLNFDKDKRLGPLLFGDSLDPKVLIDKLSIHFKQNINVGSTLIIFDEVQESPDALNSLKYFHEEANEYHVCAAGSLLGVKLLNTQGFPVGQVNIEYLYPLDFFEFLAAIQETQLLAEVENITRISPIVEFLHAKLIDLFKIYLITGGMPEAINTYVKTQDLYQVREKQAEILNAYYLDFAKHAPKEQVMKIMQVWESIPSQLVKENKKFIYSAIRQGARANDFEIAIQWLVEADLICKTYNISVPNLPLTAYVNPDIFKLYMFDVGLYGAIAGLDPEIIIHGDELFKEFKGSLTETYAAQVLHKLNAGKMRAGLYYWTSNGRAEVDFVIQHHNKIYPLEVKSGTSSKQRSLSVYAEKYTPPWVLRTSPQNLKTTGNLINIPLYMLGNIRVLLSQI